MGSSGVKLTRVPAEILVVEALKGGRRIKGKRDTVEEGGAVAGGGGGHCGREGGWMDGLVFLL